MPEIKDRGASLVAISPQTPTVTEAAGAADLPYPVLSDAGNRVAAAYGLAYPLPESVRPLYAKFGIDLEKSNGDDSFGLPVTATYVIDRSGEITWAFVDSNHTRRAEPDDVLDALDALR